LSQSSHDIAALLNALDFAADKHRYQRRKGADRSPYINHPIEVAAVLAETGGVDDMAVLMAAALHDTIEDTETTAEELGMRFGDVVCGYVKEVTDDKSLEKAERKKRQVEHAPHLSEGAKLIKLADKICNVSDIVSRPPADWDVARRRAYFDWAEAVVTGLEGVNAPLEARFRRALEEGRSAVV